MTHQFRSLASIFIVIFAVGGCEDQSGGTVQEEVQTDSVVDDGICLSTGQERAPEACDDLDNDCDGIVDEGFNLRTDASHCGACGNLCDLDNASSACVDSQCQISACEDGFYNLDSDASNGCEVACPQVPADEVCDEVDNDCDGSTDEGFDLRLDITNCGSCGTVCSYTNGDAVCEEGQCRLARCQPGFGNLDGDEANGCESDCVPNTAGPETCDGEDNDCDGTIDEGFDLTSDGENCGVCGQVCTFVNATGACRDGACELLSCDPGFLDGDFLASNGCESECNITNDGLDVCDEVDNDCNGIVDDGIDKQVDPLNCGGCGRLSEGFVCRLPNAEPTCIDGKCAIARCTEGFADADGDERNGCERPCELTNDGIEQCDGIDNDCDGLPDEGYDLGASPEHCGECNFQCDTGNAVAACRNGRCIVGSCPEGAIDADQNPLNGCEYECTPTEQRIELCDDEGRDEDCDRRVNEGFDILFGLDHCGGCGKVCDPPNAVAVCTNGNCDITECDQGWYDTDGLTSNGCELECTPADDGVEVCNEADDDCDGVVDEGFDLSNDGFHCGACGVECSFPNGDIRCQEGECVRGSCFEGWLDLNAELADGCEYSCIESHGGQELCDLRDNDCDGQVDEETNLETSNEHCGQCNTPCRADNADIGCQAGECIFSGCKEGFVDIDGDRSNGCEAECTPSLEGVEICNGLDDDCNGRVDESFNIRTDPLHCGACGNACETGTATPGCDNGRCVIGQCPEGFVNADLELSNGCEYQCVPHPDGLERCDAEGRDDDCDTQVDEGFDILFDVAHCGGCNQLCAPANAIAICNQGVCENGGCNDGWFDADGELANGCELECTPSADGFESCNGVDDDCDAEVDEDFDLQTDLRHCGVCNQACAYPNGLVSCQRGQCVLGTCRDGWKDLNGDPTDGCEYSCIRTNGGVESCDGTDNDCDGVIDEDFPFDTSAEHCGECFRPCAPANAIAACQGGRCVFDGCVEGFSDLNADLTDGCEVECVQIGDGTETCNDLDDDCDGFTDENFNKQGDPTHCGQCNVGCETGNATPACLGGRCLIGECPDGKFDADGAIENGCEYDCVPTADGVEICDGQGRDEDCDTRIDEGFDLDTDLSHCGACNAVCSPPNGIGICNAGTCELGGCDNGWVDADEDWTTGCELECTPSDLGFEECNGRDDDCDAAIDEDFDLQSDVLNCGVCELQCFRPNFESQCVDGQCTDIGCREGWVDANNDAVDGCEYRCTPSGPVELCNQQDDDCDGRINEGFDLQTNLDHCGACNSPCQRAQAETECIEGQCLITNCEDGFEDIDQNSVNGCEAECTPAADLIEICNGADDDCDGRTDEGFDLNSDLNHCGSCGAVCDVDNGTPICLGGTCRVLSCDAAEDVNGDGQLDDDEDANGNGVLDGGYADLDGVLDNGCECPLSNGGLEICDGLDNDCNGVTDDPTRLSPPADFQCLFRGVCINTAPTCSGGGWACPYPDTYEADESSCDSLDNDCDGIQDEGFPNLGAPCSPGVGACQSQGVIECASIDATACSVQAQPQLAVDETCNDIDDDCDGTVDEQSQVIALVPNATGQDISVFAFEASRPDASDVSEGSSLVRACSKPGALPWTQVDFAEAQEACQAVGEGWDLCQGDIWTLACGGSSAQSYPYGDTYAGGQCNGNDYDTDAASAGDQDDQLPGGTLVDCVRNWSDQGIYDLSGNVWEWTTEILDDSLQARALRGGSSGNIATGLTCDYKLAAPPSSRRENIGFRCCKAN